MYTNKERSLVICKYENTKGARHLILGCWKEVSFRSTFTHLEKKVSVRGKRRYGTVKNDNSSSESLWLNPLEFVDVLLVDTFPAPLVLDFVLPTPSSSSDFTLLSAKVGKFGQYIISSSVLIMGFE